MCGIFGYIGKKNSVKTTIEGLKKLEYRGYDSSGIAGIKDGKIHVCKEVGKIAALQEAVAEQSLDLGLAIAQTRWATHGRPSKENAHPHFDELLSLALVHNGIIENYDSLRKELKEKGKRFVSETDTEVIAQLIASFYEGDILEAIKKAMPLLKGSYAIALIHKDAPDQIIAIAHESPIAIGIGEGEIFLSSDFNAFSEHTQEIIFLADGEIAVLKTESVETYDAKLAKIVKKVETLSYSTLASSKGHFQHYTLKEIFEQPVSVSKAFASRIDHANATAFFENLKVSDFQGIERILILACGTSWHAGRIAALLFEEKAKIPVQVEIASEFRYRSVPILPNTLVIAISQSGETADTIAAVRELKTKTIEGKRILAICNSQGSTLSREADDVLFLRAGQEVGVCSTKAFSSQVIVLSLFALMLARMRGMSHSEGMDFLKKMEELPFQIERVLSRADAIRSLAGKYAKYEHFFFLGRNYMFPAALEGALKLKEISYIDANGYPAGEMKHGPIALINENCPTVAFCANKRTYDKILSNLMEVKARNGAVIAIAEEGMEGIEGVANDIIYVPSTLDELAAIPSSVAAQLFAYYVALERGAEIDQPRNLAKSVTVE
jgi:glucosamine--fructose-6-phosphate aminotransferase (isomerizing)